jgi:hypothetical protein
MRKLKEIVQALLEGIHDPKRREGVVHAGCDVRLPQLQQSRPAQDDALVRYGPGGRWKFQRDPNGDEVEI